MLIVCPSCATSYKIEQASLGGDGRTVRCARCKATWFASPRKQISDVDAFVDGVIAEADTQSIGPSGAARPASEPPPPSPAAAADDFGAEAKVPLARSETPPPSAQTPTPETAVAIEPATIADAPSLVPPIEQPPVMEPPTAQVDADDIESYAARRERMRQRRKQSRRSSRWTAIALVLFSANVALIGARDEVVRYLPQTASLFAAIGLPVNLRHLRFEKVHIAKETQDNINILIVEGTIASAASRPVEVPRLRFAARNAAGQELYTWTMLPSRSILGPGEELEFRSRLASPPPEATDVMVRFFTAQDAAAEGK